jgi:hypothetical protein
MSDIGADPSRGPQEHWKVVFGLPVGWIEAGNKLCLARQEPEIRRLTVPDLRCLTRLGCVHSTGKWRAARNFAPGVEISGCRVSYCKKPLFWKLPTYRRNLCLQLPCTLLRPAGQSG